jgi:secondary thiamine-phosphate synthase enzyme
MRIHSEYITVQTQKKHEFMNITSSVKDAADKSGIHDGVILICTLHSNSGLFINDSEGGLLEDIESWLDQLAPLRDNYRHGMHGESNASAHLQSLLLNSQALVSLAAGKLELGPWQQIIFAELDGTRPKRILIKVMGE